MSRDVVIIDALRTPFTRAHKGALRNTRPDTLAAEVIKALLVRNPKIDPAKVEDVILGCAMPEAEQGMNVARIAAILAGVPVEVPAMTINRFCSSGSQSIGLVADRVALGHIDLAIAGGTESMTMIPMGGNKVAANPEIMAMHPETYTPMGTTAENVARLFEVSRADQDAFAYESHRRAVEAIERGYFSDEIATIEATVYTDNGPQTLSVSRDDGPRPDTSVESLSKLRPAFDPTGTITAGNASPLTDGAGAAIVASAELARALELQPLGYFRRWVAAGVAPELMGIGPVPAIRKLLAQTGLTAADIDVFEINEAFAAQSVYCVRELGLDPAKVNPNGGAIALGHPLGTSGARMIATILRQLKRTGGKYGVVSMCIGGGMGFACLVEAA